MNAKTEMLIWGLVLCCCLLVLSCATRKDPAEREFQLFDSIETGMSRSAVNHLLGETGVEIGDKVYYHKPAPLQSWKSPKSLGTIVVQFSTQHQVVEKWFYGARPDDGVSHSPRREAR